MMCLTVDDVYVLCNRHQWFTCGTIEQYDKMFSFVREFEVEYDDVLSIQILARMIWVCSNDDFQNIFNVLNEQAALKKNVMK